MTQTELSPSNDVRQLCFFGVHSMFSFRKRLTTGVRDARGRILMAGIVGCAVLRLRLRPIRMLVHFNHNDLRTAIIALLPIFAVGNAAFHQWIFHVHHLTLVYPRCRSVNHRPNCRTKGGALSSAKRQKALQACPAGCSLERTQSRQTLRAFEGTGNFR